MIKVQQRCIVLLLQLLSPLLLLQPQLLPLLLLLPQWNLRNRDLTNSEILEITMQCGWQVGHHLD